MSGPTHRRPHTDSRLAKMREWFLENPGEFLTADDVAVKFGCSRNQAQNAMHTLRMEGLIDSATMYFASPERAR